MRQGGAGGFFIVPAARRLPPFAGSELCEERGEIRPGSQEIVSHETCLFEHGIRQCISLALLRKVERYLSYIPIY